MRTSPHHRWFPLLACALAGVTTYAQQRSLTDLPRYANEAMAAWRVPGMAIGVVHNGEVVFARGFGVRATGADQRVDENTLFAVASNTKAFTAALLGTLVDAGEIEWDDRVIDHLPRLALAEPWVTRDIRIRDLLCHRSGLPTFGGDHLWIGSALDSDEIVSRLRYLEPTAPFRARYQYQNLMFLLAGEVFEAASETSWHAALKQRIFEPLGMTHSTSDLAALRARANVAAAHEVRGGEVVRVDYDDVSAIAPAGAINSNVVDMCRWMLLHLGDGRLDGKRVLSRSVVAEMQTSQVARPVSATAAELHGTNFSTYGLGWGLSDYHGHKLVSHGGGLSGMISLQTLVPDSSLGVIVLSNLAPNALCQAITYRVLDELLGRPARDWSAEYLRRHAARQERAAGAERQAARRRKTGTLPSAPLIAYTGDYHDDLSGRAEVRLESDRLVFDYNPRHRGTLEHWQDDTFEVTWDDPIFDMAPTSLVHFGFDATRRVASLRVTFYHEHEFTRVVEQRPMTWTGVIDEASFAKLHELTEVEAPAPRGTTVSLGDANAYLSLPGGEPPFPGVLVIHEWWGLNDHIRNWTDRLAADGYAALAVDLYGGTVATTREEAQAAMQAVDPKAAMATLRAGLGFLKTDARVAAPKLASLGWCFGGGWSLDLAMAAKDLDACVIYYGRLVTDTKRLRAIDAEILGIFGTRDTGITPPTVDRFEEAMEAADRPVRVLRYDAAHAFANPSSARYDAESATRAWRAVRTFLRRKLK